MNKKLITSLSIIGVIAAVVIGGTIAYYNDTETSAGNIFTAGTIDLKVDNVYATYNGGECVGNCQETGNNLIVNGGFETPNVSTGGWAIFPDGSLTSWNVKSGAGLEIQDHAAGDPHLGDQLAELDSNNSSAISQNIATVAGGQYRLRFWYSPRPNRPAGDNTIDYFVKVVSDDSVIVSGVIGATAVGGSNTTWQEYVYNFIATSNNTKIMFSDAGFNNSYGGYLDDISVKGLTCTNQFPNGGICSLWNERDLGNGDTFFSFNDVKPGDSGTNIISMHVFGNDAYGCLLITDTQDNENGVIDSEVGDTGEPGELSGFLNAFLWQDSNHDNAYNVGEPILYGPAAFKDMKNMTNLPLTATTTAYIGLAWCLGAQTVDGTGIHCSGAGNQDIAQTDIFLAPLTAYAEQQRNNSGFQCKNVILP
ncbi:MAG: TasA family protein [Candidatus Nealsonbacteria bacterium]|nr:TasA family protein [Candidatus Nealsonbacteria bacterium]